jgi:integrase
MAKREWLSIEHKIFRLPNGKVYARPSIPGMGRKEFALPPTARTVRQMIAAKERIVAEKIRANEPKPKALIRVEDLSDEVRALKAGKSFKTRESADLHLSKHIVPWANINEPYMDRWDESTIERYILDKRCLNPTRKLFNDIKHLRMLSQLAYRKGILPRPLKIRDPDPPREAGRRFTRQELEKLRRAANFTMRGQIDMAATMGMRRSEILLLAWDRVDMRKRTIHLRAEDTKIRRARTMGTSQPVHSWLTERRKRQIKYPSPWVFPSRFDHAKPARANRTAWTATKRRAKVKGRFHDLRHTFLSATLLERKANPLHVAVYAGVSLAEIQKTYLHPSVEDTRHVAWDLGDRLGRKSK